MSSFVYDTKLYCFYAERDVLGKRKTGDLQKDLEKTVIIPQTHHPDMLTWMEI